MMKKILMTFISFIILCISIWLQIGFLNSIPLVGVTANLGIVLIAGLGLVCGKLIGGSAGLIYGLLIDLAFGRTLGIYTILYCLTGFVSGSLNNNFSKENKISMVMLILLITTCFEIIVYFLNIILKQFDFDFQTLFTTLVLESIYNIFLTILLFKPIAFWGDILNHCKNSYYLL